MDIEIKELAARPTLVARFRRPQPEVGKQLGELLPRLFESASSAGQPPNGPPFARFHDLDPANVDVEAGVTLDHPLTNAAFGEQGELPACRAATALYVGPYEGLGPAYDEVYAWVAAQGEQLGAATWEFYETDPRVEPDPTNQRTRLVVPLA